MNWTSTKSIRTQLVVRIVLLVFDIILLGTLGKASTLLRSNLNDYWLFDAVGLAAAGFSFIWCTASLVMLLMHLTGSRLHTHHPAIELSFDLVSWLLFWVIGGFVVATASASEGQSWCLWPPGGTTYSYCENGGRLKQQLDIVSSTFMLLNGLIHIIFFGFACHAVKMWRRESWGQKRDEYALKTSRQSSANV